MGGALGYCRGVYYFISQMSVNGNVCGVVTAGGDLTILQDRSLPLLRAVCANINA